MNTFYSEQGQINQTLLSPQQNKELLCRKRFRWTIQEQRIYLKFIESNQYTLEAPTKAEKQKIYTKMSRCLDERRSAANCKSHHQKILHKFKNIQRILKQLPRELETEEIQNARIKRFSSMIMLGRQIKIEDQ